MSTANFHRVDSSKVFACECDEEWDYRDLKDSVSYALESFDHLSEPMSDENELHSYPSSAVITLYETKEYKDYNVHAYLTVVIRSGYYSGVNLDYTLTSEVDDYYKPLTDKQSERTEAWIKKAHEKMIKKVEKVFTYYSTPLEIVGAFSNGEVIYKAI